ncbi:MAG: TMEM165/GDT1 family protein [Cyanobacteriota bacterium]|nr:TMEM165/GDT1 family protein [Cyanobacteriota bacterium]
MASTSAEALGWLECHLAELGDTTLFMAPILAARHRGRGVLIGAFAILTTVTLLTLFLGFGLKLLIDVQRLGADAASARPRP